MGRVPRSRGRLDRAKAVHGQAVPKLEKNERPNMAKAQYDISPNAMDQATFLDTYSAVLKRVKIPKTNVFRSIGDEDGAYNGASFWLSTEAAVNGVGVLQNPDTGFFIEYSNGVSGYLADLLMGDVPANGVRMANNPVYKTAKYVNTSHQKRFLYANNMSVENAFTKSILRVSKNGGKGLSLALIYRSAFQKAQGQAFKNVLTWDVKTKSLFKRFVQRLDKDSYSQDDENEFGGYINEMLRGKYSQIFACLLTSIAVLDINFPVNIVVVRALEMIFGAEEKERNKFFIITKYPPNKKRLLSNNSDRPYDRDEVEKLPDYVYEINVTDAYNSVNDKNVIVLFQFFGIMERVFGDKLVFKESFSLIEPTSTEGNKLSIPELYRKQKSMRHTPYIVENPSAQGDATSKYNAADLDLSMSLMLAPITNEVFESPSNAQIDADIEEIKEEIPDRSDSSTPPLIESPAIEPITPVTNSIRQDDLDFTPSNTPYDRMIKQLTSSDNEPEEESLNTDELLTRVVEEDLNDLMAGYSASLKREIDQIMKTDVTIRARHMLFNDMLDRVEIQIRKTFDENNEKQKDFMRDTLVNLDTQKDDLGYFAKKEEEVRLLLINYFRLDKQPPTKSQMLGQPYLKKLSDEFAKYYKQSKYLMDEEALVDSIIAVEKRQMRSSDVDRMEAKITELKNKQEEAMRDVMLTLFQKRRKITTGRNRLIGFYNDLVKGSPDPDSLNRLFLQFEDEYKNLLDDIQPFSRREDAVVVRLRPKYNNDEITTQDMLQDGELLDLKRDFETHFKSRGYVYGISAVVDELALAKAGLPPQPIPPISSTVSNIPPVTVASPPPTLPSTSTTPPVSPSTSTTPLVSPSTPVTPSITPTERVDDEVKRTFAERMDSIDAFYDEYRENYFLLQDEKFADYTRLFNDFAVRYNALDDDQKRAYAQLYANAKATNPKIQFYEKHRRIITQLGEAEIDLRDELVSLNRDVEDGNAVDATKLRQLYNSLIQIAKDDGIPYPFDELEKVVAVYLAVPAKPQTFVSARDAEILESIQARDEDAFVNGDLTYQDIYFFSQENDTLTNYGANGPITKISDFPRATGRASFGKRGFVESVHGASRLALKVRSAYLSLTVLIQKQVPELEKPVTVHPARMEGACHDLNARESPFKSEPTHSKSRRRTRRR